MSQRNTIARSLSEVGLAAWFGGSLMGAIGVNGAAAEVDQPGQRARVANAGWNRWTPVNLAAIGAHLVGSVVLTGGNKGRIAGQKNVASTAIAKTAVTAGALGRHRLRPGPGPEDDGRRRRARRGRHRPVGPDARPRSRVPSAS